MHALADLRDADESQRTKPIPNSLLAAGGMALSHNDFRPCFEALNRDARDMFPDDDVAIRLDNAAIRLYSDDREHREPKRKKICPEGKPPFINAVWACAGFDGWMGGGGWGGAR